MRKVLSHFVWLTTSLASAQPADPSVNEPAPELPTGFFDSGIFFGGDTSPRAIAGVTLMQPQVKRTIVALREALANLG